MRKFTLLGFILLITVTAWSQDREYKTLVDFDEVQISGLGGPFMQFTAVDGEFAHMMGGGGAILVGDFFFGGYGLGLTNTIYVDRPESEYANIYGPEEKFSIGHGGFWMGYALFGDRAIHVTLSSFMGWGQIGIADEYNYVGGLTDGIFVVCPTMEVELNLTQFFRLGVGASYNIYTSVNNIPGYTSSDFSAPGGFLSFKFGWF